MADTLTVMNDTVAVKSAVGSDVVEAKETTSTVVSEEEPASILSLRQAVVNDKQEETKERYPNYEEFLTTITAIGNICGMYDKLGIAYKGQDTRENFRVESILDVNEGFKQVYDDYVKETGAKDFPEALKEYIRQANEKHTPFFQFTIQDTRTKQHHIYKSDYKEYPRRVYHVTEEDPRDAFVFCFYPPFGDEKYDKEVKKRLQKEYKKKARRRYFLI